MSYQDYLRSDAANLGVEKVLSSSPDVLLGVDGAAVHALSGLSGLSGLGSPPSSTSPARRRSPRRPPCSGLGARHRGSAPDIAAIQAGSRAQADNTTPSGLAAPIVAFSNPPALPDPAGLSSTLTALTNGAVFRDVNGSATAQALALAALSGAGAGATAAGQQGVANTAMAEQKDIEMAKIAAGVLTGGMAGSGATTVSEKGVSTNEGGSLDERAASDGAAGGTADGPVGGTPDGTPDGTESHEAKAAEGPTGEALKLLARATDPARTSTDPNVAPTPTTGDGVSPVQRVRHR